MKCREIDYSKRKLRGNRRYYRNLERWAANFFLPVDDNWYNLWHVHPDWYGRGNASAKARRQHLKALFPAFERGLKQAKDSDLPFQIFVAICVENASRDALFFHTPNPNAENFPHRFEGCQWQVNPPGFLKEFVDSGVHEIGMVPFDGKTWYAIVPIGTGGRITTGRTGSWQRSASPGVAGHQTEEAKE